MAKVSIHSQIIEAERELAVRRVVYPRRVGGGKMRQGEADLLIEHQEAIIATLKFCRAFEPDIRTFIADRQERDDV